ncbi:phosphatase PAP2 family protein [Dickeya undicola]|uniref:Lipid A 1-diphosphate synthase n=1 Tax=Dickeya undicola TaxID=1577887 RepID=A0A3N0GDC4_9GAMM|nr:phosphatase PAP2 family protein [Dickeya undicola]RNM10196.1 phosphatase PAP2 family protein [Dickeya undicola]RNM24507.1 phosphatase PAP2 family protein [Dickeya undicola]
MSKRNTLLIILFFNLLGFALFFSWYLPAQHGFWFDIDTSLFFYFNQHLATSSTFLHFVAITNNRAFDACALLAMGLLYLFYYLRSTHDARRQMLLIGLAMLVTAVVLNQLGHLIPVQHSSPTLFFSDINRVVELTGIPTKDASSDSFPGDHGMMLMIFAAFMLRYFGRVAFAISVLILLVFSTPRIMIGAHWFTDVAVGSLSVVLVGLSWWLLTPACDALINRIDRVLPGRKLLSQQV